jgi:hypothetical protein
MSEERSMASLSDAYLGWEGDPTETAYDARHFTRGQARATHARELGVPFIEAPMRKAYGRWLTRQDVWEEQGQDYVRDEVEEFYACPACGAAVGEACDEEGKAIACDERVELVPDKAPPPEVWDHTAEQYWAWQLCKRDDPGAIPIYLGSWEVG